MNAVVRAYCVDGNKLKCVLAKHTHKFTDPRQCKVLKTLHLGSAAKVNPKDWSLRWLGLMWLNVITMMKKVKRWIGQYRGY